MAEFPSNERMSRNVKSYNPTIVEQIRAILAFPFAYAAILIGGGYFCVLAGKSILDVVFESDGDNSDPQ